MSEIHAVTKRPRVGKNIVNMLGSDICNGVFKGIDILPSESDLCTQYGVSRTVIREALNVVESKGLIRRKSRVGTRICPQDEWNILDEQVINWLGAAIYETNIFESVLEARRFIEPLAAELAAERASITEIAALETAWQAMADAGHNVELFSKADFQFHKLLLKASHNRVFQQLEHSFQAAIRHSLQTTAKAADSLDEAVETHFDLVEALRMRDKQAAKEAVDKMLNLSARDFAKASVTLGKKPK